MSMHTISEPPHDEESTAADWQDVARDAVIGRTYLPREDRLQFGYTDELLKLRSSTPEFTALLKHEVERAGACLQAGLPLVAAVPSWLQLEIDLFIHGGLLILQGTETMHFRVWERRPPSVQVGDGLPIRSQSRTPGQTAMDRVMMTRNGHQDS